MATIDSEFEGQVVEGTDDVDSLTAKHNNVTLIGGDGGDGVATGDELFSDRSVDGTIMDGGAGIDFLTGNGTNDTASYASSPAGVTVDLFVEEFGVGIAFEDGFVDADPLSPDDSLNMIENVTGSDFNDSLTGDDLENVLQGGAGDDRLAGNGGADVFKYSIKLEPGGGGETFRFTDWLSEKYGKDFGDELPDFSPKHHHHHHKHGKDDKHHSKDGDHGKNDKHDRHGKDDKHDTHGKDDGHHSKGDHHAKNDKHCRDDGHHAQDGGLTEKFFEKNYTEWLKEVVVPDLLAQGFELDANGNGKIKIDINEDSRNGTPRIEGLTKQELAEIFGDRDSVILRDGHEAEKAFYSNSYTSPGGGQNTVASDDGFDTIVDFTFGEDKLDFSGVTEDQFLASFVVDDTQNVDGLGGADTVFTIAGNADWSLTLLEVSGHNLQAFADDIFA